MLECGVRDPSIKLPHRELDFCYENGALKMQDLKIVDQMAWRENAAPENDMKIQDPKMQDMKMHDLKLRDLNVQDCLAKNAGRKIARILKRAIA